MSDPEPITDPTSDAAVTNFATAHRISDLLLEAFHQAEAAYDNWPLPAPWRSDIPADPVAQQHSIAAAVRARDLLAEAILARTAALNTGT